jgi:UDP-N-acetylglucosamine--N-acetylmuramyl-(pentapeptide) pyrophosphoryl-undecaprenol N-acetylglucosamine transferase
VLAALVRRIPVVTVSYDAIPGRATRLAARFASASAVAFPGSSLRRSVVTGAPLRATIVAVDPERDRGAARHRLGLPPDRFVLLVVGGLLGSGPPNEVTRTLVAATRRADLAGAMSPVPHATGRIWRHRGMTASCTSRCATKTTCRVRTPRRRRAGPPVPPPSPKVAARLASILVPWPLAADDHQTANARVLADAGGAYLVPDAELDSDRLTGELARLADAGNRAAVGRAAASIGRRDGAARVAALVQDHAR